MILQATQVRHIHACGTKQRVRDSRVLEVEPEKERFSHGDLFVSHKDCYFRWREDIREYVNVVQRAVERVDSRGNVEILRSALVSPGNSIWGDRSAIPVNDPSARTNVIRACPMYPRIEVACVSRGSLQPVRFVPSDVSEAKDKRIVFSKSDVEVRVWAVAVQDHHSTGQLPPPGPEGKWEASCAEIKLIDGDKVNLLAPKL
jgi:hypothetical protein